MGTECRGQRNVHNQTGTLPEWVRLQHGLGQRPPDAQQHMNSIGTPPAPGSRRRASYLVISHQIHGGLSLSQYAGSLASQLTHTTVSSSTCVRKVRMHSEQHGRTLRHDAANQELRDPARLEMPCFSSVPAYAR